MLLKILHNVCFWQDFLEKIFNFIVLNLRPFKTLVQVIPPSPVLAALTEGNSP